MIAIKQETRRKLPKEPWVFRSRRRFLAACCVGAVGTILGLVFCVPSLVLLVSLPVGCIAWMNGACFELRFNAVLYGYADDDE